MPTGLSSELIVQKYARFIGIHGVVTFFSMTRTYFCFVVSKKQRAVEKVHENQGHDNGLAQLPSGLACLSQVDLRVDDEPDINETEPCACLEDAE